MDKKEKGYYGVLNVLRTSTQREIKKAYKKAALVCHPDKGKALLPPHHSRGF
jgi:curved DNA-binding protein CbpA